MHFGHGTMSQIVCIQVVSFGRNIATKEGPCPKCRGLFVKKIGPMLPHYEDLFIF
jgi:hypothetical protein